MKKTIIRSTLLLIIVSVFAKILSFIVRILLARNLSVEAMSYYTLAAPTMVIIITLAQMGIPSALSKVIAENDYERKPLAASILITIITNTIIALLFLLCIPYLAHTILKQNIIQPVLYSIVPLIPVVSLSGILKGYLYGIQQHLHATNTQIFEELTRVFFLLGMFLCNPTLDAIEMATLAMFSITIGEVASIIYMLLCIKKQKKHSFVSLSFFQNLCKKDFSDIYNVAIPMTSSRLIGSLTYFLEPIVMVIGLNTLQVQTMVHAYGELNGYVLPILTMPSFITITLSNFLLPSFTYHFTRNHIAHAKKLFNVIIGCCFLIGVSCSFICYQYAEELLQLFYHNTNGADVLRQLSWPFALYSLQPPLSSMMHALSKSRGAMFDTLLGCIVRILCVIALAYTGPSSLTIGLTLGMLVTTILHAIKLANVLRKTTLK